MRKNEPRLYPSDTYLKTVLVGWRGFLEGSLDDADQVWLKHHPGPTPGPDDVSHMSRAQIRVIKQSVRMNSQEN